MLCLSEDITEHSHTLLIVRPAIEKFILGVKYVESQDGLLERLDTLAFYINDLSKSFGLSSTELFKLILSCDEVKEVLRPFVNYANDIQNKVIADPRHKTLKPYLNLLLELLKKLELLEKITEEGMAETAKEMQKLNEKTSTTYRSIYPTILPAIQRFISEAKYLKSVEGFLERLDTLASYVTDVSKDLRLNPEEVFKAVLSIDEVKEVLASLAPHAENVKLSVESSPRHKPLKPYLSTLVEVLKSLPPADRVLEVSRLPTFLIEEREHRKPIAGDVQRYLGGEEVYEPRYKYIHHPESTRWSEEPREHANVVEKPRRIISKKKIAATLVILIVAVFLAGYYLEIPWVSSLSKQAASAVSTVFEYFREPTVEEIKLAVLNKINGERQKHGLPPVQLLEVGVAQRRAEYIIFTKFWGHCTPSGEPPSYLYTFKNISMYYPEENLGLYQKCVYSYGYVSPDTISLREALRYALDNVHRMIYDDAHAGWGHRDSLLDPTNNYVDIAVAVGKGVSVIAIHMLKVWVRWTESPVYNEKTGLFSAKGVLTLPNSMITSVLIYKHGETACYGFICLPKIRIDLPSQYSMCNLVTETNDSCLDMRSIAGVVPPNSNMHYVNIETIKAIEWDVDGQHFSIKFVWRFSEPGIYSIVIWAKNTLNIKHPYDIDRYTDTVPILKYTVKL